MNISFSGRRTGVALLMLPLVFGGCRLVDQTTFDPALRARLYPPAKQPRPETTNPVIGPPPLLIIRFPADGSAVDYTDSLRLAVNQALARKPDVHFDVVTVVADTGNVQSQFAIAQRESGDARQVASAIRALGVDEGQIALGIRPEAGLTGHLVQVFVH